MTSRLVPRRHRLLAVCSGLLLAVSCGLPARADPVRDDQWYLKALNVAAAQRVSKGSGVVVAVIDSGVKGDHPDLSGNVLPGLGLVGDDPRGWTDASNHGTAMAGLIAGHGHGADGQDGALGIAPEAKLLPLRISDTPSGNPQVVPEAINEAVARGAKVISMSIGLGASPKLKQAVDSAIKADVVVVAASGNRPGELLFSYPAAYPGVVAVGATGRDGSIDPVTVTGAPMVMVAPGADIYTTASTARYAYGTGTSNSTAIVAGAAALIRAKYPDLSATEVIHRLTATATDKGAPGRDDIYGFGSLNLVQALTADVPPATAEPSASASAVPGVAAPPPTQGRSDSTAVIVVLAVAALLTILAMVMVAVIVLRRRRV